MKARSLVFALTLLLIASHLSFAVWPAGAVHNTNTTKPWCPFGSSYYGQQITYTNWKYTDSSGVNHYFNGTSYTYAGAPAYCNGYSTSFTANSTDSMATEGYTINVTGGGGTVTIFSTSQPKYNILSVLYAPPGNVSGNGYTQGTSNGVTTTMASSFTQGTSITFSFGFNAGLFGVDRSTTFGFANETSTSHSFDDTYSKSSGSTLLSNRDPVDHSQDVFFLWLNPLVMVTQTGSSSAVTTLSTTSGQPMDIIDVDVKGLQNPTVIPLGKLEHQNVSGYSLPGLSSICAHPLPDSQCTQANACGCVPSDFTAILNSDPLISASSNTPPSNVDSVRYKLVNTQLLQGPECQGCNLLVNSFTESDSQTASTTTSSTDTYSVSYGTSFKILKDFTLTPASSFSWSNTKGLTHSNGTNHSASVSLGSSTYGCYEYIDIYEDTEFHTFTFVPSPGTPSGACP